MSGEMLVVLTLHQLGFIAHKSCVQMLLGFVLSRTATVYHRSHEDEGFCLNIDFSILIGSLHGAALQGKYCGWPAKLSGSVKRFR